LNAAHLISDGRALVGPSASLASDAPAAARRDRSEGTASALLVRIGAAAGALAGLLALASLAHYKIEATPTVGGLLNAAAVPLLLLWFTAIHRLQSWLSPWKGAAAERWRMVAHGLCLASTLAMVGLLAVLELTGHSLSAQLAKFWGAPIKLAVVSYAASTLLLAVVAMRAGVLPAGAMALWGVGTIQNIFGALPGALLMAAGLIWSSIVMWRKAGAEAPAAAQAVAVAAPRQRLLSLDMLRGLIMMLMAIDHMRMMLMPHPLETWDAALPRYDSAAAFLSRFITHFCAPGFFFLMGAGMVLFADARGKTGWNRAGIAGHWILRGLLLVIVDQLVINPVLNGRPTPMFHQVLTGLGSAMIIGALLLQLRAWPLAALGAAIVLVNQVLPSALVAWHVPLTPLVRFLLLPGQSGQWFFLYSLFGWLGVAVLGMAFGRAWLAQGSCVFRWMLAGGLLALPLFVLVRLGNGFGNIRLIEGEGWIGFLNVVKYPPSLAFLLLTLGVLGILLYLLEQAGPALARWGKPLLVFGRTALFFYVTHMFIYKALQIMWVGQSGLVGVNLATMYIGWAAGVLLLYPICLLYGQFKREKATGSLWRLF